ncbi:MAG: NTE family protein [Acidimicrobiales bacterium]
MRDQRIGGKFNVGSATAVTRDQLATCQLLSGLPDEALADMSTQVTIRSFSSGEVLCRAGDAGTSAFLVLSGRFRAEAGGRAVGEIGRGELVGELSLLTGEPRSATVVATRDSETLELTGAVFNNVLATYPGCYQSVSRQVVGRLQQVLTAPPGGQRATIVSLLGDGSEAAQDAIVAFIRCLDLTGDVVTGRVADLAAREVRHKTVVIAPPAGDIEVDRWALGQSDRTLYFVDARRGPVEAKVELPRNTVDLVLVHPSNLACPSGTARWIDLFGSKSHHHIRASVVTDIERVIRRLRSEETVLVLSGGGARGLAHAGLYRALVEHGIAIDAVAGVSSGAIAAAVIAMGLSPQVGGETAARLFGEGRAQSISPFRPSL